MNYYVQQQQNLIQSQMQQNYLNQSYQNQQITAQGYERIRQSNELTRQSNEEANRRRAMFQPHLTQPPPEPQPQSQIQVPLPYSENDLESQKIRRKERE